MTAFYRMEEQKTENQNMFEKYTEEVSKQFGTEEYCKTMDNIHVRMFEKLNQCIPFFASGREDARIEANRLIRNQEMTFCQFMPLLCMETLLRFRDKMDSDNMEKYENYVKNILDEFIHTDLDFVGVNDNFPCIATYIVLMGGIMFDRSDVYAVGIKRLEQLAEMFQRRGCQSEFNSQSYIAGQINAIALIAERMEDPHVKELALKCEERLWVDFLGHVMPNLCCSAGPRSRSYLSSYVGGVNAIKLLYQLFGEQAQVKPKTPYYSDLLLCPLHCPTWLAEWYLNRTYPYEFHATFEVNSSNDGLPNGKRRGHQDGKPDPGTRDPYQEEDLYEYPSCAGSIHTYMEQEYSLGTATREFHNGQQTDSFLISYPKKKKPQSEEDAGWVFTRYVMNDKVPGQPNSYPEYGVNDSGFNPWDMGRKTCIQKKNSAMVLYKPKAYACKNVKSMRLCLIFPAKVNDPVKEIYVGDEKVENYTGSYQNTESVFVSDGEIYMAFHPMILTNYGRKHAVTVEKTNDMVMVSFYNYEGEERDFTARGFLHTGNGFVCEVRKADAFADFEEFRKKTKKFVISDRFETNPHVRQTYQRISSYETDWVNLKCEYSPASEGIRYQMVDGKLLEEPKLSATGLCTEKLPFME